MADIPWEYLYVVYSFDREGWRESLAREATECDVNSFVTIQQALATADEAKREVERLRGSSSNAGIEHHYQQARYYRHGRVVQSARRQT